MLLDDLGAKSPGRPAPSASNLREFHRLIGALANENGAVLIVGGDRLGELLVSDRDLVYDTGSRIDTT